MKDLQAQQDLEKYCKAMCSNYTGICTAIEKKYDLYGYPPELVTVGLRALADGKNMHKALDKYMGCTD